MPKNERDDLVDYHENDILSVEHIWAQTNRDKEFPSDHLEKRRLGNLVLMGLNDNKKRSDKDIPIKIDELKQKSKDGTTDMIQVGQLNHFFDQAKEYFKKENKWQRGLKKNYYKELSMKINDLREKEMIEFALKRWQIEGENPNVDFKIDSFNKTEEGKYLRLL